MRRKKESVREWEELEGKGIGRGEEEAQGDKKKRESRREN